MKPVEIVTMPEPEPAALSEGLHRMRITDPKTHAIDVSGRVISPGETGTFTENRAIALYETGSAVPTNLVTHARLWASCEVKRPARPEAAAMAPEGPPNVKVVSGSHFQGNRSYIAGEQFRFRGDLVRHLAMQSPEPGSAMAEYVRQNCARRMAVIEPIAPLGPEESKRLNRLRRDPLEPNETQLTAAKRLYELAASL